MDLLFNFFGQGYFFFICLAHNGCIYAVPPFWRHGRICVVGGSLPFLSVAWKTHRQYLPGMPARVVSFFPVPWETALSLSARACPQGRSPFFFGGMENASSISARACLQKLFLFFRCRGERHFHYLPGTSARAVFSFLWLPLTLMCMSRCVFYARTIKGRKLRWKIPKNFQIGTDPVMAYTRCCATYLFSFQLNTIEKFS